MVDGVPAFIGEPDIDLENGLADLSIDTQCVSEAAILDAAAQCLVPVTEEVQALSNIVLTSVHAHDSIVLL